MPDVAIRTITSADEAWEILREFAGSTAAISDTLLVFDNYPQISIKYEGTNFNAAIPVRVMDVMRVMQSEIYRIYALVVYEDGSYSLSPEEKDSLELFFKVAPGSSEIKPTNLIGIINNIVEKGAAKLTGRQWTVVALIAATTFASTDIVKSVQDGETRRAEIESQAAADIARSQSESTRASEETERLRILQALVNQSPPAKKAVESAERVNEQIAKSVKREESVTLADGTVVTEIVAKELYPRAKRRSAQPIRMDGTYQIDRVDKNLDDLRIEITIGGKKYSALATDLPQDQQDVLFHATGRTAFLEINAKDLEGEIKDLEILKAAEVPSTAGN